MNSNEEHPGNHDNTTSEGANQSPPMANQSGESSVESIQSPFSLPSPQRSSTPHNQEEVRTLFVSGLDMGVVEGELQALFSCLEGYEGFVLKSGSVVEKITTPVGFVRFRSRELARQAMLWIQRFPLRAYHKHGLKITWARCNTRKSLSPPVEQSFSPVIQPSHSIGTTFQTTFLDQSTTASYTSYVGASDWFNKSTNQLTLSPPALPVIGVSCGDLNQNQRMELQQHLTILPVFLLVKMT